jgi:TldD protein
VNRREFLKSSVAAGGLLLLPGCARRAPAPTRGAAASPDPQKWALADVALQAAREAGASYADVRIADYRNQYVATREERVEHVDDSEDRGFGVRVIADGAWGFAASASIEPDELARVARRAVELARGNARLRDHPVRLAPVERHVATWSTPIRRDPFEVPLEEKVATLLGINATALRVSGVSFCSSFMHFVREHKFFASSEGSAIEQTLHRCRPGFSVTAVDHKRDGFQTRNAYAEPQGMGYEYVEDYPWDEDARQAGEDAVAKHAAPSVSPGPRDLILHPTNLWLTIHESIGHPTELDRALGMEANYAGTSFLTPDKLGHYRLGSEIVNFVAERTEPGGLATCGYDDDGVKTGEWPLVEGGIFVDYQVTRDQAHWIDRERSTGSSYAQSWKDVAFQRMPNINLAPGQELLGLEELIAGTDDGILVMGRGSYSIDQQRYNFQFGGQAFYEVKGGKVRGMLKDVAYQSRTPDFWKSCDAIGGAEAYELGGSFYDGKGEPGQVNAVSHGCAPARFRRVNVLNTSRSV